jgi:hypothetical protein
VTAAMGLFIVGPATGIIAGGGWGLWNLGSILNSAYQQRRVRARISVADFHDPIAIRLKELNRVSIVRASEGWALRVPFQSPPRITPKAGDAEVDVHPLASGMGLSILISGDEALRTAGKLLPALNETGAKRAEVESAVNLIGDVDEPARLFDRYASAPEDLLRHKRPADAMPGRILANLPREVRLALEMASHEESERRALDGELSLLHEAWQQAEAIAAIADDMFISDATRAQLSSLKRANDAPR